MKSIHGHPVVAAARQLTYRWHSEQLRKYSGDPYLTHCEQVANLTAMACPRPPVVAAAWLQDVLEDTDCPPAEISTRCGGYTLELVLEVTDVSQPEDGNRATRKALDRDHLARASPEGQTIKLADLVSNTLSIAVWDPNFARTYLEEKRALLGMLRRGDPFLARLAREILVMAEQHVMDCATAERLGRWAGS